MNKMCNDCIRNCKTDDEFWGGCIYRNTGDTKMYDYELDRLTKKFYKEALKEYKWRMSLKDYDENEAIKDVRLLILAILSGYDENISLNRALEISKNIENIVWHNEFLVKHGFTDKVIDI